MMSVTVIFPLRKSCASSIPVWIPAAISGSSVNEIIEEVPPPRPVTPSMACTALRSRRPCRLTEVAALVTWYRVSGRGFQSSSRVPCAVLYPSSSYASAGVIWPIEMASSMLSLYTSLWSW